ncbi:MAG: hypothetical protein ACI8TS_000285 [Flavobacteriales bacterium]|jgi:hypothetical protein
MNDPLKHIISKSPPQTENMLEGHEERFFTKVLAKNAKPQKRIPPIWKWSAVAVAASILIVVAVVFQIGEENQAVRKRTLGDVSQQIERVESQLTNQISQKTAEIDMSDPVLKSHVSKFKNLEKEYLRLEEALNVNFGDPRIVKAMMENYKRRLQVLETMLTHIKLQNLKEKSEPKVPSAQS